MKTILTFLLACLVLNAHGQGKTGVQIGLYRWTDVVMMQPCNLDGTNATTSATSTAVTDPKLPSKAGQQFRVLEITDKDTVIIMVLDYTVAAKDGTSGKKATASTSTKALEATPDFFKYNFKGASTSYTALSAPEVNSRNYGTSQRYFRVSTSLVEEHATHETNIGGALAFGVINFPFKYWPQPDNQGFSGSFNFGAGIGYKFPHKTLAPFTYSLLSGYSISNVVLDAANSNQNANLLISTNNFTALSFSIGGLVEYQKVQAGLFLGWDRISDINQQQFDWQYQGRPWLSVGFGFAIFSAQKEQTSKTLQQD